MPELPEVETIAAALRPAITGRRILEARTHPSARFAGAAKARGACLTGLRRRGKYLIASLDDGNELVLHLGMTGQLGIVSTPSDDAYVRVALRLDDGRVLELRDVRRFGRAVVVRAGDYHTLGGLARLGPEPLEADFDKDTFAAALARPGAPVKTRLLAGRLVAGIGNIYTDEALWAARVHPKARQLRPDQAEALHGALVAALRAGLAHGGTTLRDYRRLDGSSGEHQHHLACYGRAGAPCRRCGAELEACVVAGRTSTYCSRCQPVPPEPAGQAPTRRRAGLVPPGSRSPGATTEVVTALSRRSPGGRREAAGVGQAGRRP